MRTLALILCLLLPACSCQAMNCQPKSNLTLAPWFPYSLVVNAYLQKIDSQGGGSAWDCALSYPPGDNHPSGAVCQTYTAQGVHYTSYQFYQQGVTSTVYVWDRGQYADYTQFTTSVPYSFYWSDGTHGISDWSCSPSQSQCQTAVWYTCD